MCIRMEVAEDLPRRFCDSSLFPGEIALKVPVFVQKRVWTGSGSVQFGGFSARATGALRLRSPTEDFEIRRFFQEKSH